MIILVSFTLFFSLLVYFYFSFRLTNEKGILIIHFFYMAFYFLFAPILHIYYDNLPKDLYFVDSKEAFLYLGVINTLGILMATFGYIWASKIKLNVNNNSNVNFILKVTFRNVSIFYVVLAAIYLLYLMATTNVFYSESKREELANANLINYMIIESVPIIFAWLICVTNKSKGKGNFYVVFVLFFIIAVLFGGMRGSRVSIIFNMLSFLLLYSYMIEKLKVRSLVIILILGFVFNSIYSNYKYAGVNGVKNYILTGEKAEFVANKESQTLHFLLEDLVRASIQAKIIDSINHNTYHPTYTPDTYISAFSLLLPKKLRPDTFETKQSLGTEAQYDFKASHYYSSSRIYGMLGESMLNFGYWGVLIIFFLFGFFHSLSLKFITVIKKSNYILFLPIFFSMPVYLLFYDLDNIIFQMIKTWLIPLMVFLLAKVFTSRYRMLV